LISVFVAYADKASTIQSIFITNDYIDVKSIVEGAPESLHISKSSLLFDIVGNYDNNGTLVSLSIQKKPELQNTYQKLAVTKYSHDAVFIYPSFTQAAYEHGGFYDYYHKKCDTKCLTVKIPDRVDGFQSSSITGAWILKLLNYSYVKDQDVDKNPEMLFQYKKVIVLHNEYVTKNEFDAITRHPNVVFLYPNALYAQVTTNYDNNTITLVKGHGYPDPTIRNGFGWNDDNSQYEYDITCNTWNVYKSGNYSMLNCYPEFALLHDILLLHAIRDQNPSHFSDDILQWSSNTHNQKYANILLHDYDIQANHIPQWVHTCANLLENNKISQDDFSNTLQYLYQKSMLE
jgi:hypothetical protein